MMKNIRTLLLSSVALLGSACFTSCQLEPMELPAEELYVRAFINKFGLIDPNQTWSQAKATEVTIVPDSHIDNARVYGIRDGRSYIVARVTDIDKKVTIPIDVPANVTDLKVDLDGDIFYTKVGGTVDPRNPTSRTFLGNKNESTPSGQIIVTDGERKDFLTSEVWQIFGILKEGSVHEMNWNTFTAYPGNLEQNIITDFMLYGRGKTITIYPIYWNTCQTHTLGIYYVNNKGQGDAEEVVRTPIYTMHKSPEFENMTYRQKREKTTVEGVTTETPVWSSNLLITGHESISGVPDVNLILYRNNESNGEQSSKLEYHNSAMCFTVPSIAKAENGNEWDSQLFITLPSSLKANTYCSYKVSMEVSAKYDCTIPTQTQSAIGDYFGSGIGEVHFPASSTGNWELVTFEGTFTKQSNSNLANDIAVIAFNLNKYVDENEFYIKELKWQVAEYELSGAETNYREARNGTWDYTHTYRNAANTVTGTVNYKTDYDNMADAHLLLKKQGSNTLYCPLADHQYWDRTAAFNYNPDSNNNEIQYVASKGINVTVPQGMRYGFYIEFHDLKSPHDDKIIYSEVDGNIKYMNRTYFTGSNAQYALDIDNPQHRSYATLCAMSKWTRPGGSRDDATYTYLSFEDWTLNSTSTSQVVGDYDMNDLAFLVEGVEDEDIDDNPEQFNYLICAEDLGVTDDFDFNDMIVGVSIVTEGSGDDLRKYVTFRSLAAGGILPLYLHCARATGGDLVSGTDVVRPAGLSDAEWHNWFGISDYTQILNTQNTRSFLPGRTATVEVPADFSLEGFGRPSASGSGNKGINGIYITVSEQTPASGDSYDPTANETIIPPQPGEAPQMFLINDEGYDTATSTRNWRWPSERKHIYEVYEHFSDWVTSASANANWYKESPKPGVYTNRPR